MRVPKRVSATGKHHRMSRLAGRAPTLIGLAMAALLAACGDDDVDPPASKPLAKACPDFAPSGLPHDAKLVMTELREGGDGKPWA